MPCKHTLLPLPRARDDTPPQIWDRVMGNRAWILKRIDHERKGEIVRHLCQFYPIEELQWYERLMETWDSEQTTTMSAVA
ncbi:hypothetical protein TWF788_003936 [Orbilia oligospora]|uniref:Uncharacterized protein n=1 Tax=Orbilia oligospora TaxID=2813651 RepID=A0A7C8Q039_ORBOL|nr:hypothetical protein TWF788_003936 [Orbilia oligospora]